MKEILYLEILFNDDGEGTGDNPPVNPEGKEEGNLENNPAKAKEDTKTKNKSTGKANNPSQPQEDKIYLSKEEYEDLMKLKLSNMDSKQKESYYETEITNLQATVETLKDIISEKTNEITVIKTQEQVKEEVNRLKTEKPYLANSLDKRIAKGGFDNLESLKDYVDLVEDDLKSAYEITNAGVIAQKLGESSTVPNILNQGGTINGQVNLSSPDMSVFGVKKFTKTSVY
jgi:hypothetical protein